MKNDSYAINAIKNKQYVIVDCKLMPSNIFKALTKITIDIVVKKIEKIFKKKYPKLSIELKIISLNSKVETFK